MSVRDLESLPRKNGELVFEALWEGRAFGMTVALSEGGVYAWDDFRTRLVAEIDSADRVGAESSYYERWLAAFEGLLTARGLIGDEELEVRAAEYLSGEREDEHAHDH